MPETQVRGQKESETMSRIKIYLVDTDEYETKLCKRGACAHPYDHGLISPLCDVEGCTCGESNARDDRVLDALRGNGWTIDEREARKRGLDGVQKV